MEPDLIGQEKDGRVITRTTKTGPQWSLTSSVRKSSRAAEDSSCSCRPAMEPDLIGQEKRHVHPPEERFLGPAMEPDLIGQEKITPLCCDLKVFHEPAMEPDLIGQEKSPTTEPAEPSSGSRNGA